MAYGSLPCVTRRTFWKILADMVWFCFAWVAMASAAAWRTITVLVACALALHAAGAVVIDLQAMGPPGAKSIPCDTEYTDAVVVRNLTAGDAVVIDGCTFKRTVAIEGPGADVELTATSISLLNTRVDGRATLDAVFLRGVASHVTIRGSTLGDAVSVQAGSLVDGARFDASDTTFNELTIGGTIERGAVVTLGPQLRVTRGVALVDLTATDAHLHVVGVRVISRARIGTRGSLLTYMSTLTRCNVTLRDSVFEYGVDVPGHMAGGELTFTNVSALYLRGVTVDSAAVVLDRLDASFEAIDLVGPWAVAARGVDGVGELALADGATLTLTAPIAVGALSLTATTIGGDGPTQAVVGSAFRAHHVDVAGVLLVRLAPNATLVDLSNVTITSSGLVSIVDDASTSPEAPATRGALRLTVASPLPNLGVNVSNVTIPSIALAVTSAAIVESIAVRHSNSSDDFSFAITGATVTGALEWDSFSGVGAAHVAFSLTDATVGMVFLHALALADPRHRIDITGSRIRAMQYVCEMQPGHWARFDTAPRGCTARYAGFTLAASDVSFASMRFVDSEFSRGLDIFETTMANTTLHLTTLDASSIEVDIVDSASHVAAFNISTRQTFRVRGHGLLSADLEWPQLLPSHTMYATAAVEFIGVHLGRVVAPPERVLRRFTLTQCVFPPVTVVADANLRFPIADSVTVDEATITRNVWFYAPGSLALSRIEVHDGAVVACVLFHSTRHNSPAPGARLNGVTTVGPGSGVAVGLPVNASDPYATTVRIPLSEDEQRSLSWAVVGVTGSEADSPLASITFSDVKSDLVRMHLRDVTAKVVSLSRAGSPNASVYDLVVASSAVYSVEANDLRVWSNGTSAVRFSVVRSTVQTFVGFTDVRSVGDAADAVVEVCNVTILGGRIVCLTTTGLTSTSTSTSCASPAHSFVMSGGLWLANSDFTAIAAQPNITGSFITRGCSMTTNSRFRSTFADEDGFKATCNAARSNGGQPPVASCRGDEPLATLVFAPPAWPAGAARPDPPLVSNGPITPTLARPKTATIEPPNATTSSVASESTTPAAASTSGPPSSAPSSRPATDATAPPPPPPATHLPTRTLSVGRHNGPMRTATATLPDGAKLVAASDTDASTSRVFTPTGTTVVTGVTVAATAASAVTVRGVSGASIARVARLTTLNRAASCGLDVNDPLQPSWVALPVRFPLPVATSSRGDPAMALGAVVSGVALACGALAVAFVLFRRKSDLAASPVLRALIAVGAVALPSYFGPTAADAALALIVHGELSSLGVVVASVCTVACVLATIVSARVAHESPAYCCAEVSDDASGVVLQNADPAVPFVEFFGEFLSAARAFPTPVMVRHYVTAEQCTSLGVVAAVALFDDSCAIMGYTTLAVSVAYAGYLAAWRPYASTLEMVFAAIAAVLQLAASALIVGMDARGGAGRNDGLAALLAWTLTGQTVVLLLQPLAVLAAEAVAWARRDRSSSDAAPSSLGAALLVAPAPPSESNPAHNPLLNS